MKKLLPVVSNDIGFSVTKSIQTWRKEYLHIRKVNPAVADLIAKLGAGNLHSKIIGILVYKLLESQAECNRMEKELKI